MGLIASTVSLLRTVLFAQRNLPALAAALSNPDRAAAAAVLLPTAAFLALPLLAIVTLGLRLSFANAMTKISQ